jgi:rhamnulokinase/L-fuculokinase
MTKSFTKRGINMPSVLAFDLGASNGRAIKADYDGEKITYTQIHRFAISPLEIDGSLHHNVDKLLDEINNAIMLAGEVDALAFDTWGVDYALLDSEGKLICPPYHYRDARTSDALEKAKEFASLEDVYADTGIQIMGINTLFQLMCDGNLKSADKLLFMPDLFSYMLTGEKVSEITISATSQMLNPIEKTWSKKVLDSFGISESLFAPLTKSATVIGEYKGIKVVSVAGHDTQCAVAAMPCESNNAAFLSCGTWSLIGCELDEPKLDKTSFEYELSNELGANGKIDFLKNISGLWLIQEVRHDLMKKGQVYSFNQLEQAARNEEPFACFIDPDSPDFSSHGNLPEKIREFCRKTNQYVPITVGEIVRCIYESLAMKYRIALEQISECTGKSFDTLHILGGGAKDGMLCQLTADSTGIPVIAGPTEATALGNIVLQFVALGALPDVESGRKLIRESEYLKEYAPEGSEELDEAYERFKKIIQEV